MFLCVTSDNRWHSDNFLVFTRASRVNFKYANEEEVTSKITQNDLIVMNQMVIDLTLIYWAFEMYTSCFLYQSFEYLYKNIQLVCEIIWSLYLMTLINWGVRFRPVICSILGTMNEVFNSWPNLHSIFVNHVSVDFKQYHILKPKKNIFVSSDKISSLLSKFDAFYT